MINKELINITLKDYCKIKNFNYSIIEEAKVQRVYIPNYKEVFEPEVEIFNFPEIAIAELFDVKIIGGNDIVYDDSNNCVYDLPLRDDFYRYDLVFNSIFYIDNRVTCVSVEEANEDIDEGILLTGVVSHNYYHFNLESLSRLCLINTMEEYNNVPLIIDEAVLGIPQLYEELRILNKGKRKIYFVKKMRSYNVKRLIFLSKLIFIPLNIKNPFKAQYKDLVIKDIAVNILHDNLAINNNIGRKILISRRDSWNPRMINSHEIEGIFAEYGYEFVFPGRMSFEEQRRVFSEAEFIAGATGAGFTNLLFSNRQATVICIVPKISEVPCYSNICGILGMQHYFIDCDYECSILEQDNNTIYENRFYVNPVNVRNFLEKLHRVNN